MVQKQRHSPRIRVPSVQVPGKELKFCPTRKYETLSKPCVGRATRGFIPAAVCPAAVCHGCMYDRCEHASILNLAGSGTKKATEVEAHHDLGHTGIGDRSRTAGAEPATYSACATWCMLCDQQANDEGGWWIKGEKPPQASLESRVSERLGYEQTVH